ncbi:winged helix-turn-helix domain-containing protein [Azospirillum sp. TSO22-1]|uniref:winged helix-turn-helix domain-containing protein n=1 Tax=Azospirillum sp. TSO22-1 TaxID=716789 RepID=UPI000D609D76|nr:winged helix-turn-helix domain-containing protein [Azospirillum sp. TSO22-1]PWC31586.1 LysR family transcriptional regulator [Azospirillum sp. TSO22-1]
MASRLRLRIVHDQGVIGPGKVALLKAIRDTGSISGAARTMDMAFRRAWFLIETMNKMFHEPLVRTSVGGREGGGAELTPLGVEVVERYYALEEATRSAAAPHLEWLDGKLAQTAPEDTP